MKNQNELLKKLIEDLRQFSSNIHCMKFGMIGYRERIYLERILFLIIKQIIPEFKITSFTDIKSIHNIESLHPKRADLLKDIIELQIFMKKISSSSAYIRGDVALEFGTKIEEISSKLAHRINKICDNLNRLN